MKIKIASMILLALFAALECFAQVPTIASFSPAIGPIGTTVTITGTNFDATPPNNIVYFGSTQAIVSVATDTELTVTVPSGATYQPISVITNGLTAYSAAPFVVTFDGGVINQTSFDTPIEYSTGDSPYSTAVSDLDGDYRSDLAVSRFNGNLASIFRNVPANSPTMYTLLTADYAAIAAATASSNPAGSNSMAAFGNFDISLWSPSQILDAIGNRLLDIFSPATNQEYYVAYSTWEPGPSTRFIHLRFSGSNYEEVDGSFDFPTKQDYTTGTGPRTIAIGDIDGDGKPDLVVPNSISNTVSIFRNTSPNAGTISFDTQVDFTTGASPSSVSIGDLDGDGKSDLVVANFISNTVSIFRNTSSIGTISMLSKQDYPAGTDPTITTIGDLDGDSKPDLIVANFSSNSISIYRNTSAIAGTISFSTKDDFTTGTNPRSVAIGDLDGDNLADLAVTNTGSNTVSVFRNTSVNDGNISLEAPQDYEAGTFPVIISMGDINGDGKVDLAVSNRDENTVSVFMNTNSSIGTIDASSFAGRVDFSTGSSPNFVSIADLDSDDKPELIVANGLNNTLSVFRNTVPPAPTITSFSPTSGEFGAEVAIIGTNFDATPSNNIVKFNGVMASVASASSTSLNTTVPSGATIGKITVEVNGQTAISTTNFVVVPTIDYTDYADTYDRGTEPTSGITFIDATDVNIVELMYKGISEDNASWEAEATSKDGNSYSATIAADDMIGTEYYFKVVYGSSLQLLSDTGIAYINYPVTNTQQSLPGLSFGDQVSNYQIISIPLELDNKNVTSVFSSLMPYDKTLWRLFDYANGDNREYSGFNSIDIGKGYWLIIRNSTTINPGAGTTPAVGEEFPFNIILSPGWNLIGNPYNFRISWQDVLDYNGNPEKVGDLQTFSGGVLSTSTTLDKYRGGFVFNSANNSIPIDIPVLRNPSLGGRIGEQKKPSDLNEKYWELKLALSQGELKNLVGGIGMHPDAALEGKDKFDEVSVPMIEGMGFFELGFDHPEYSAKFNKEVIPTTDNYTWEFEVYRDNDEPLKLSWSNEGFGDNDRQIYLFNPTTSEVLDMRNENNYEIGVGTTSLQILFGSTEYIGQHLDGAMPIVGEPYPNPTGYTINCPFRISGDKNERVTLKVYDNTGRLIGEQEKEYEPGYYQLDWQFDHPGLYLLKVQIGSIRKTNKIIVR